MSKNLDDIGEKALITNIPFEIEEEYVLKTV